MATATSRKQLHLRWNTLGCENDMMVLEFDEVIRILQEQTFNELADRILGVVEDLFGFGHGGVVWLMM